jgi:hypothetical protein
MLEEKLGIIFLVFSDHSLDPLWTENTDIISTLCYVFAICPYELFFIKQYALCLTDLKRFSRRSNPI